ncbi:hypothetical protein BJF79_08550 [Actinomadura sp. CNU-125]|uniref:hypothetical protein n=1 Tax=Actinomadura sp. CNU-125 TaxID=1904961 RepID=UPI000964B4F0|nr:hypothetical protein [Actinomadura sp. CNU-125]OLT31891.1 hypothetical protein BJF79_08550 [Actinomadura sp. CNU-125]
MDPAKAATLRWFPLVARSRPRCSPLDVRVNELCVLADAAARNFDRAAASSVLNQAALLASDVGLHKLAQDWCHRHASACLRTVPLDAATARRALEPLVNLARLHIRAGNGDSALDLLDVLYKAVTTRTDTTIEGHPLPASSLTSSPADHQQLRRWLWTVNLADGTRALTSTGRWTAALTHLRQHNGIGRRMLDGRQVAVISHALTNDHDEAQALLTETTPGAPWEKAVTSCLSALCGTDTAQDAITLMDHCQALGSPPDLAAFDTRLRLSALDAIRNTEQAVDAFAAETVRRAINARDGYAARDVLTNETCATVMTDHQKSDLTTIVEACALGSRTIPHALNSVLSKALTTTEAVLTSTT